MLDYESTNGPTYNQRRTGLPSIRTEVRLLHDHLSIPHSDEATGLYSEAGPGDNPSAHGSYRCDPEY